jgi:hypothetical protein
LENHAPEQERLISLRKPTPWSSADIKPEKQKRRRLERKWRGTRLQVDYDRFKQQRNKVNAMLNTFRIKYYSDLIRKNANNPKALFKILDRALHRKQETPLPPHESEVDLANDFSNFFNRGVIIACLSVDGTSPSCKERLTILVNIGRISSMHSLRSDVGMGSSSHNLFSPDSL